MSGDNKGSEGVGSRVVLSEPQVVWPLFSYAHISDTFGYVIRRDTGRGKTRVYEV